MRPETPSDPLLRHEPVAGGLLAYTDEGGGPTLLAIHGLPGSHRDYRWLASALAGRVRLVRIDQPGFGESSVPRPPTDWRFEEAPTRRTACTCSTRATSPGTNRSARD